MIEIFQKFEFFKKKMSKKILIEIFQKFQQKKILLIKYNFRYIFYFQKKISEQLYSRQ